MQDYDLTNPTLGEVPERVNDALRDALTAVADERPHPRAAVDAARERLHERARARLHESTLLPAFEELAEWARRAYGNRDDNGRWTISGPFALMRLQLLEMGRRIPDLEAPEHVFYLRPDEVEAAVRGELPDVAARVQLRRGEEQWARFNRGPARIGPPEPPMPPTHYFPAPMKKLFDVFGWMTEVELAGPSEHPEGEGEMRGRGVSGGRYTGPARHIGGPADFDRVRPGDVVICRITSPEWSLLFGRVGALVTEEGGFLSHPAIIAREFGIPAVVAVDGALSRTRDGEILTIDADTGQVFRPAGEGG
jgi:rifampicin phosphotransferase